MNEKLILETLANLTENHAKTMTVIAGIAAVLSSRLEYLSSDERKTFQENSKNLLEIAMKFEAPLQQLRIAAQNCH
jgi:hypothetical protein